MHFSPLFSQMPKNGGLGIEDPAFTWPDASSQRNCPTDIFKCLEEPRVSDPSMSSLRPSFKNSPKEIAKLSENTLQDLGFGMNTGGAAPRTVNRSRMFPDRLRPSSASTCGDLEEPHRVTPQKSRRVPDDDYIRDASQPGKLISPSKYKGSSRHRSVSRTSNISIKRSSTEHRCRNPDPERKKVLMHQVARYWNECIGLADEEKEQAKAEIDQLRFDLQQRQTQLHEAQQQLRRERENSQRMEDALKQVEQKNAEQSRETQHLTEELSSVREQLASSKEKAGIIKAKSRAYRAKLNEAILEQQRLFVQAKDFYSSSIQQLREENDKRDSQHRAVEEALANTGRKREQLKQCLEDMQTNYEEQLRSSKVLEFQFGSNSAD